jgi:hypothetical protein
MYSSRGAIVTAAMTTNARNTAFKSLATGSWSATMELPYVFVSVVLCLYVMDWGVCGCAPARAHPPVVRKRQILDHRNWTFAHDTRKKKRHAAHTAQSRTAGKSDACRMGHPRRRGYCTSGTLGHWASYSWLCVLAYSTRSQLKLGESLDLFGIPALLERLEGDPEISKATVSVCGGRWGGRRRVSALADSR